MTVFPACTPGGRGSDVWRIIGFKSSVWAKTRRMSSKGEIDAEFHVFHDIPGSQLRAANDRPGERHAAAAQQTRKPQLVQAKRAYKILEQQRECRPALAGADQFGSIDENALDGCLPSFGVANQALELANAAYHAGAVTNI